MSTWVGGAAVAIGVPLAFVALRWIAPYRPPPQEEIPPLEELTARYHWWDVFFLLPLFVSAVALGIAWYYTLVTAAHAAFPAPVEGSVFVWTTPDVYFGIPCIFLGIVSAGVPVYLLAKLLFRERLGEYMVYGNLKHGFDSVRVFTWLSVFVGLGSAVMFVQGARTFARLDEDGLTLQRFTATREERRGFDDVEGIYSLTHFRAPNGDKVARAHHAVRFRDGSTWSTNDFPVEPDPKQDAVRFRYLAERTGLPIVERDELEDRN